MKLVLDTNVLISAFFWQGNAERILKLAQNRKATLCVTDETIAEFQKVLEYPKFKKQLALTGKNPSKVALELIEISKYCSALKFSSPCIIDDPSDDKFLACALSAQADFIISGDQHLLKLKSFYKIPIVAPKEFLELII